MKENCKYVPQIFYSAKKEKEKKNCMVMIHEYLLIESKPGSLASVEITLVAYKWWSDSDQ